MGTERDARLDGLRGLACLAVVLVHVGLLRGGIRGVDVFFVLSGYLIAGLTLRETDLTGRLDVRRFYARRARRLLPALAFMLAVYVCLAPQVLPQFQPFLWRDVGAAALYLTTFTQSFGVGPQPLIHTWSLSVEEQFYLLWPVLLLGLRRMERTAAAKLLWSVWAGLSVARLAWLQMGGVYEVAYFFTPFHVSGIVLGSAIVLDPPRVRQGWAALLVLALTLVLPGPETYGWATPLAELMTALVLLDPPKLLAARTLAALGRISYGVYLWHLPIYYALGCPPGWGGALLVLAPSLLIAAVSYRFIEQWWLRPRPPPQAAARLPTALTD